jgi:transcriptional regulator GlxA family with amidase domain
MHRPNLLFLFSFLFAMPLIASMESAGMDGALTPPARGKIRVAFVLTEGATMIDFAGPWEVFQDVHVHSRGSSMDEMMPFELYTVSDTRKPIRTSGGMTVVPDYTFDDAPAPRVVVVGAQRGRSRKMMSWLSRMGKEADVVMSVCTGAFKIAQAGLLDGKTATTHHDFYDQFEKQFPNVQLVRDRRFIRSDDVVFTAGGLTSGIDLALHVVERYFGRDVAQQTARYMEYEGTGWKR